MFLGPAGQAVTGALSGYGQAKQQRDAMKNQPQQIAPGGASLSPDQNARITRVEQKLDKLIKHLGVK